MSATRGEDVVPQRSITASAASRRRRTSPAYADSRPANVRCATRSATSGPAASGAGGRTLFWRIRMLFLHNSSGGTSAMAWDFETDPEFQAKLDWAGEFVRGEGE